MYRFLVFFKFVGKLHLKKLPSILLYMELLPKLTIHQRLIKIFIFCKKQLLIHKQTLQKKLLVVLTVKVYPIHYYNYRYIIFYVFSVLTKFLLYYGLGITHIFRKPRFVTDFIVKKLLFCTYF